MKKLSSILSVALIIVMLCGSFVFADGEEADILSAPLTIAASPLTITNVFPQDGNDTMQPSNMCVKFTFDKPVVTETSTKEEMDALGKYFTIKDKEGKSYPFTVTYNAEKRPNELWLVLNDTLEPATEYFVTAKDGIPAADGSVFQGTYDSSFATRNTSKDTTVTMILTVAMMFVIVFLTMHQTKKQAEESDPLVKERNEIAALNPYKLAKQKGISVEEANAYIQNAKDKYNEKVRKIAAEKEAEQKALEEEMRRIEEERYGTLDEDDFEYGEKTYKVKGPKSIKKAGGHVPASVIKKNKKKRDARRKQERANEKKGKK